MWTASHSSGVDAIAQPRRPSPDTCDDVRVTSRSRVRVLLVLGVVVVLGAGLVAACGGSRVARLGPVAGGSSAPATVSPTQPSPASGPLARFYTQRIVWGTCAEMAPDGDYPPDRSDCGRLTVPVDYTRPHGATASLAVFRLRAAKRSTGVLVTNPGGPGVSGVDYMAGTAAQFARIPVGDSLDIVGFDPRGVGRSTPAVASPRCATSTTIRR